MASFSAEDQRQGSGVCGGRAACEEELLPPLGEGGRQEGLPPHLAEERV